MNFVDCSLTELRRRPIKSIIFMLIFSVIFAALIIGLNMRITVLHAKEEIIGIIGPYYRLNIRNSENEAQGMLITNEIQTDISRMQHVRGVNRNEVEYALAGNFYTVRDNEGVIPDPDPGLYAGMMALTPNSVVLDANTDCALIDAFRLGDSVLLKGDFPDESKHGVLLEERLAEQNQLTIGDSILLAHVDGNEVWAEVIGIYRTQGTFSITEDNPIGEAAYVWSPYNRVYASIDIAQQLYGLNIEELPLDIYVDSVSNMSKVGNEIKGMDIDWEHTYVLYDMTVSKFEGHMLASQIEEISTYATAIIIYAMLIGAVLLSLVLNLFLQYYIQDAGILIALGSSKTRVIFQHLFSTGIIAVAAGGVALCISVLCTDGLIGKLIQDTTLEWGLIGVFKNGLEHTVTIVPRWITIWEWGWFILGMAALLAVSVLPLLRKLFFLAPRSILAE